MAKTPYSGEMVRNNKKVILTIPGAEMAEAVMGCGSTTDCDTDKVDSGFFSFHTCKVSNCCRSLLWRWIDMAWSTELPLLFIGNKTRHSDGMTYLIARFYYNVGWESDPRMRFTNTAGRGGAEAR